MELNYLMDFRIYPACCTSAFCGRVDCTDCPRLPTLIEFKDWCARTAAKRLDPIWCPTAWTATKEDPDASTVKQYKRLGSLISDARLGGYIDWEAIDWEAIEDRTRSLEEVTTWEDPQEILNSCALGYCLDKWATQPTRVELWVEKEALAGIFERACADFDVPYLSCRGYGSQSMMWGAAQRLEGYLLAGQSVQILHFGDHDPSGLDMTRDIRDRLNTFLDPIQSRVGLGCNVDVKRVALNMDQVEKYNPPPNPTKTTDSRATDYISAYGEESWELDALNPATLTQLAQGHIKKVIDRAAWNKVVAVENHDKKGFEVVSKNWREVLTHLRMPPPDLDDTQEVLNK